MALKFFWRCEGTTLDGTHDFSASDTTATAQGSPSISASAAKVGSNGILWAAGNTHYRFDTASIANRNTGAVAFWFRIDSGPSSLCPIFMVRGTSSNDYYLFQINNSWGAGTAEVRLTSRSTDTGGSQTEIVTSGASLDEDTWYFAVIKWDQPNSLRRVEVYDSSLALITGTTNSSSYVAPLDLSLNSGIRIGESTGISCTGHIDNVFIGDAYADGDVFVSNANISSYTDYSTGGGTVNTRTAEDTLVIGDQGVSGAVRNALLDSLLAVADQGTGYAVRGRVAESTLEAVDDVIKRFVGTISMVITDSIVVDDPMLGSVYRNRIAGDAITVSEVSPEFYSLYNADAPDVLDMEDQATFRQWLTRSADDPIEITDSSLLHMLRHRLAGDTIDLSDGPTVSSTEYQIDAADTLTITDGALLRALYYRIAGDDIGITDELLATLLAFAIISRVLSDTIALDEGLVASAFRGITTTESLTLDDAILRAVALTRELLDGVDVSDDPLASLHRFLIADDSIEISDSGESVYVPNQIFAPRLVLGSAPPPLVLGGYAMPFNLGGYTP